MIKLLSYTKNIFLSKKFQLASLFLLYLCSLSAQKIAFKRISVEDGLQNNIVFSATQDKKGFMWFATFTGIDKYDGSNFYHYKLPSTKKHNNDYVQVNTIITDINKQLWTATANSVFLYNYKLDKFEVVNELEDKLEGNLNIQTLTVDKKGRIWIGFNNALIVYDLSSKKVLVVPKVKFPVKAIFQDKEGKIFIGTNATIYVVKEIASSFDIEPFSIPNWDNKNISWLSKDEQGRLWIGTVENGLFVFQKETNQLTQISFPFNSTRFYTVKKVFHSSNDKKNYVALDGGGLFVFDENLKILSLNQADDDDPQSLSNNGVYDIYKDSFERFWVVTYGGGIHIISTITNPFTNFYHVINNNNSLSNNVAKSVTEDAEGNLWFGTKRGVSKYNPKNNLWEHINQYTRSKEYTTDNVLAITNSFSGNIWIATYGGGLTCYNPKSKSIRSFTFSTVDSTTIGTDYVFALCEDYKGNIWSGGIRGPVSVFDNEKQKFKRLNIGVNSVSCIIETSDKKIAVGSEKGVHLIDPTNFSVKQIVGNTNGQISPKVISVFEYQSGKLWIGTQGAGLLVYNMASNKIEKVYKTTDGLSSDIICGMLKDKNGDVWISTSRGISHFQIGNNRFVNYNSLDGLAGSQFNFNSCYKTKKGDFIFGSTNGFSLFNPLSIKSNGYKPYVHLTGITINNKLSVAGEESSPLVDCLDESKEVILKYSQNSFSIDFISPTPFTYGKHLYSWKLEGFDKIWSPLTTTSNAVYANLREGKYTFMVKAFAKGQQNDYSEIRTIEITIKSPWWRSWWAYLIYLTIIGFVSYLWYTNYKIETTRKRYAERLELQANIAHEIRTPLTLIKGPLSTISNDIHLSEDDKKNLELAKKNIGKLENLVSQFIDYHKSGIDKQQMQVSQTDIVLLLQEVIESFKPLMEAKNISFSYLPAIKNVHVLLDKEKIEKVFSNLLSNAIKYTPANKTISINIETTKKEVIISFSDTGIGIPGNQQQFIFKGYYRADNAINLKEIGSGIGLNIVKEMIDLHHGSIDYESVENIGSTFTVKLPIKNDYLEQYQLSKYSKQQAENPPPKIETIENYTSNAKILVVEDNDELRHYLEKELSGFGYKIYLSTNGKEAIEVVKKHTIDLIISDLMMPEMDGFQLCEEIKKDIHSCHIPFILLTALHDKEYILQGFRTGADDYIKKPFEIDFITTRIENLLQNKLLFKSKMMSAFETPDSSNVVNNEEDVELLKKVSNCVLSNYQESDFTVEKLAKLMAMSRSVLFKKFKAITNQSLQGYINQVRLKKAVELLQTRKYSISEIAFMIGFEDPKYFSTAFKKHFDKTPSEYVAFVKNQNNQENTI